MNREADLNDGDRCGVINPLNAKPYSKTYYELLNSKKNLLIQQRRKNILDAILNSGCVVIDSNNGSGKSTQIPQFLLSSESFSNQRIIVCHPNPSLTKLTAIRVAKEMDLSIGDEIGYAIPSEYCFRRNSKLLFCVDEVLVKQFLPDGLMSTANVIIIDEAQERTVYTDIIVALLKKLIIEGRSIKLVILTASYHAAKFQNFFECDLVGTSKFQKIKIESTIHTYEIEYEKDDYSYDEKIIPKIQHILESSNDGDIIVFLPSDAETDEFRTMLLDSTSRIVDSAELFCIKANFETDLIDSLYTHSDKRRIIFTTKLAESAFSFPNIKYVIDSGMDSLDFYSPLSHQHFKRNLRISCEKADQRALAISVNGGICYRLYSQSVYDIDMNADYLPDILRTNLVSVIMILVGANIGDVIHLPFMDTPHFKLVMSALDELVFLNAIDPETAKLTEIGYLMAQISQEPKYASSLINGYKRGVLKHVSKVVSVLNNAKELFIYPFDPEARDSASEAHKKFISDKGDFFTILNAIEAFEQNNSRDWCETNYINYDVACQSLENFKANCEMVLDAMKDKNVNQIDSRSDEVDTEILKSLLSGLLHNVAYLESTMEYKLLSNGLCGTLYENSFLDTQKDIEWVIFDQFEKYPDNRNILKTISPINPKWLHEILPDFFDPSNFSDSSVHEKLATI